MATRSERLLKWEKLQASDGWWDWDVQPWLHCCIEAHLDFARHAFGLQTELSLSVGHTNAEIVFNRLTFYGLFGDLIDRSPDGEGEFKVIRLIEQAKLIHSKAPYRCDDRVVSKIISVAEGRRCLETRSGRLEPIALSVLGGVSEGRIRNLMAGVNAELASENAQISVSVAQKWLQGRKDYYPSIWSQPYRAEKDNDMDTLRVPQASDGTVFHPGLRRRSGYMVGEKGNEQTIESYDQALKTLTEMEIPKWRRPNIQGNWGIVKGISWIVMSRRELNNI